MTGDLKIETWQEPADKQTLPAAVSPDRSTITYSWHWYWHVPPQILWVILFAALVGLKENRNKQAWLIFVPVIIVLSVWEMVARHLLHLPSSNLEGIIQTTQLMVLSLAILGTVTGRISHCKTGKRSFFLTLAVLVGIGIIGMYCNTGCKFDQQSSGYYLYYGIWVIALLLALAWSRRSCRKKYHPVKFILYLFLWIVLLFVTCVLLTVMVIMIAVDGVHIDLETVLEAGSVSFVMASILYAMVLPFMILAFTSRFYRERLEGCLRLSKERISNEKEISG